ncbi:hypothetical protein LINPERPRIM_LOCUS37259, partial [Linum perenne]
MTKIHVSLSSSFFIILIISSCVLWPTANGVETCSNDKECETKRSCSSGTISVCRNGTCTCLHVITKASD